MLYNYNNTILIKSNTQYSNPYYRANNYELLYFVCIQTLLHLSHHTRFVQTFVRHRM